MLDLRLLLLPLFVTFGGWASLTLEDVPDYLVAGQPVTLSYLVRQHGVEPLSDLRTSVDARAGDLAATAVAQAGGRAGRYVATLTLPQPGDWTISINTGFWPKRVTLLPITVIAPGAPAPVVAAADRGQQLFLAKGCVTCHVHRDVPAEGAKYGPDLTGRRFPAEHLTQFLADPAKTLRARGSTKMMPNLELKPKEIAALVAFLSQGDQAAGR